MEETVNFVPADQDPEFQLTVLRDRGLTPQPELVQAVRARYLLALRDMMQRDKGVVDVVKASWPATDAFKFVEQRTAHISREGTEDIFRDAIMFLLAELDELRGEGDRAYVVDTATGEIVAPITPDSIVQPAPFEDERGNIIVPPPRLNPELALALTMRSVGEIRAAEVRRKAEDPVRGLAYKHLTEPDRIVEIASRQLEEAGMRRRGAGEIDANPVEITFGKEAEGSDTQSTNPFYHRLSTYSSVLARRVSGMAGDGGSFWIGPVRLERDGERRWYSVLVQAVPAC